MFPGSFHPQSKDFQKNTKYEKSRLSYLKTLIFCVYYEIINVILVILLLLCFRCLLLQQYLSCGKHNPWHIQRLFR